MRQLRNKRRALEKIKDDIGIEYRDARYRLRDAKGVMASVTRIQTLLRSHKKKTEDQEVNTIISELQTLLYRYPSLEDVITEFDEANMAVEQLRQMYEEAKTHYEKAAEEFRQQAAYIDWVMSYYGYHINQHIAPQQEVIVQFDPDMRRLNVFFGGQGYPLGPGHGHYVFHGKGGRLVFRRDPV